VDLTGYSSSGWHRLLTRLGHNFNREEISVLDSHPAEIKIAFALWTDSDRVRACQREACFPVVLSGNCAIAVGTLSGCGSQNTRVFWFDAHGESTTPDTTTVRILGRYGISTLTGQCWGALACALPGFDTVLGGH
jgi:arginase